MGFIGVQPATVPLTSSDITDGIISTAKIADDAVGNTKLDLTANYAFTGTITGAGTILQVVHDDELSANVTTNSTSYSDSGLSVSITPSSSSNKILILCSHTTLNDTDSGGVELRVLRDSTDIWTGRGDSDGVVHWTTQEYGIQQGAINLVDSPSSTSAITYKLQIRKFNAGTAYLYQGATFMAMEISA